MIQIIPADKGNASLDYSLYSEVKKINKRLKDGSYSKLI